FQLYLKPVVSKPILERALCGVPPLEMASAILTAEIILFPFYLLHNSGPCSDINFANRVLNHDILSWSGNFRLGLIPIAESTAGHQEQNDEENEDGNNFIHKTC